MLPSETGQSGEGYGILLFIGLVIGILYMWVFKRPFWDALYIIPLAIIGTAVLFAIFIVAINYFHKQ